MLNYQKCVHKSHNWISHNTYQITYIRIFSFWFYIKNALQFTLENGNFRWGLILNSYLKKIVRWRKSTILLNKIHIRWLDIWYMVYCLFPFTMMCTPSWSSCRILTYPHINRLQGPFIVGIFYEIYIKFSILLVALFWLIVLQVRLLTLALILIL